MSKSQQTKKKPVIRNVLVLIHFEGKPSLTDEYSEELRWSTLRELLKKTKKRMLIISDHPRFVNNRMNEFRNMVIENNKHSWLDIDPIKYENINHIEMEMYNKRIIAKNVIFGGTNTGGCLCETLPYSALKWAKEGHNVKILLPMCTDYEQPGVTAVERNNNAFAQFWMKAKEWDVVENIDFITDIQLLND